MAQVLGLFVLIGVAAIVLGVLLTVLLVREARRPPRRTAGYAIARDLPCDPGELGLSFDEWTLDRPGGVRLPVWEINPSAGTDGIDARPRAPVAVFVHGWGQSRIDMLSRLDPWIALCDRLLLYDLRGHGDATGGLTRLGCDEEQDLLEIIRRLDDRRVVLVGYSMGAVIALHAATSTSDVKPRIAGVVAHAPYVDFHTSLRGRLRASTLPARPFSDLAMRWFRLGGMRHRSALDAIRDLPCPLLLLHNRNDRICPLEHSAELAEAAPDATLVTFEGEDHLHTQQADPAAHQRAIRQFMSAISSAESDHATHQAEA